MLRRRVVHLLVLLVAVGMSLSPPGQPATAGTAVLPRVQTVPIDSAELAAWLEPLIEQQMKEAHIPGAVFLLVQDGAVAYARDFGVADLERQTPVDLDNGVWRVMSLSKPVTAVAIMQLVEQGKLDLHADANSYLRGYQLPDAFGQPISADQLLTHSAGLDWDLDDIGTEAAAPAGLVGNAQFLHDHPPARVLPPGQHYLYSNAAFDIAGQMVEDVSGMPFAEYVDRNIFQLLGMAHSSFVQPPQQPEALVTGYEFDGGTHQPVSLPLWQDPPSRALTATAPDMARFMQALLGDGSPILKPDSLATLLDTHYTYLDGTPGMAYGWHEDSWPGVRVLTKDGGGAGALSRILLLPEHGLGFFLAYNLDDGFGLANAVADEFLQRTFPFAPELPLPAAGAAERAAALAGGYRLTTYSHHTISKLLRLSWPDYPQVAAQADGRLTVHFAPDADATHALLEVAPRHYRTDDGKLDYVFWPEAQGRPAGFAVGDFVTEKVAWYDTGRAHMILLGVFLAVFLAGAVAGLLVSIRHPPISRLARGSLWLLTLTGALNFAFLVILLAVLNVADIDFTVGMPAWLTALMAGPLLTSVFAVALGVLGVVNWQQHTFARRWLALYGLFTLVCLAFIPWLDYWNLLGFRW